MSNQVTVFLVDDDPDYLQEVSSYLKRKTNLNVRTFESGCACLNAIDESPSIVVIDFLMALSDREGKHLMNEIQKHCSKTQIVLNSMSQGEKVSEFIRNAATFKMVAGKNSMKAILEMVLECCPERHAHLV